MVKKSARRKFLFELENKLTWLDTYKVHVNNYKLRNYTKNLNCDKLHKYLSNHFTLNNKLNSHTCDICNIYISNTLKGIAAHKKGCKKKMCAIGIK